MSPWDVLGWLLVFLLVCGLSGGVLTTVALGVAMVFQRNQRIADVLAWETTATFARREPIFPDTSQIPERTEWKSWEHGRAVVVVDRGRGQAGLLTARLKSNDLGEVFGSPAQIAKLLLQRRYRRV